MAKYAPLARVLRATSAVTVRFTFAEIDALVGGLPRSARVHDAWWANEREPRPVQKRAWSGVGFEVEAVDRGREIITFRRRG